MMGIKTCMTLYTGIMEIKKYDYVHWNDNDYKVLAILHNNNEYYKMTVIIFWNDRDYQVH